MAENTTKRTVINLMDRVESVGHKDRYEMLFNAMEGVVDDEQDAEILTLIAAHLYQLSEKAIKKAGVVPDKLN